MSLSRISDMANPARYTGTEKPHGNDHQRPTPTPTPSPAKQQTGWNVHP